jgi:hypothetical protein
MPTVGAGRSQVRLMAGRGMDRRGIWDLRMEFMGKLLPKSGKGLPTKVVRDSIHCPENNFSTFKASRLLNYDL